MNRTMHISVCIVRIISDQFLCTLVKSKGKISQNYVAFSEYMNFNILFSIEQTKINRQHMYINLTRKLYLVRELPLFLAKNWQKNVLAFKENDTFKSYFADCARPDSIMQIDLFDFNLA